MIEDLGYRFDVSALNQQLAANRDIWDRYRFRTSNPLSPHRECSDIWARYNDLKNMGPGFNDEHESVWYPVAEKIPAVLDLCDEMQDATKAHQLGGVLITKIPAWKQVYPHSDHGWHAEHYEKFAILLQGNTNQAFCFDGIQHRCEAGDSFTFNNQHTHWVLNPTDEDRMTLIICARKH